MEATGSFITVNIDGKPLEKLIEVVSNGIGTLYRPRKIRKEADAQAYAIKVLENAKAIAGTETMLIEAETVERIGQRLVAQEIRRQNNIDSVVEKAAEDLKGKQVSDDPVDEDWATRFFGIVQDVSQEEMKILWSKILSKEIERPSTFSMRTLETLRNLSAYEAELFEKVAPLVLYQGSYFVFNDADVLEKLGVHYIDLAQLTECGILLPGTFVRKTYESAPDKDTVSAIVYGNKAVILELPQSTKSVDIPIVLLSKAGEELLRLLEPEENMDYIKKLSQYVKKKNSAIKMQYAEIVSIEDGDLKYMTPTMKL
jgi:hypothetical protein